MTTNDSTKFPKLLDFDKVLCDVPCSGKTIKKHQQYSLILNLYKIKKGDGTFRKNSGLSKIIILCLRVIVFKYY